MNLTINYVNGIYSVTGEGIAATVENPFSYHASVKGKGSRNYKNEILEAVKEFAQTEAEKRHQAKEKEIQEQSNAFKQTELYKNLDLLSLYNATVHYYDSYHGQWMKYNKLLTGLEVKDDTSVINAEKVTIKNTDIYSISIQDKLVQVDERLIKVSNFIYVTGLTLKEKLLEGLKSYDKMRKAQDHELRMLQQLGKQNKTSFILGESFNLNQELSMAARYQKEIERASNSPEEVELVKQYTNDGKEIQYAFFCSKPSNISEVKEKRYAVLEKYVIDQSITLDKDTFELFEDTLNMDLLNVTFTGGTNSTYEPTEDTEEFYQLSEIDQALWIKGAYNIALEVVCKDYNYSIIIDPQGYDYPRYIAIVEQNSNQEKQPINTNNSNETESPVQMIKNTVVSIIEYYRENNTYNSEQLKTLMSLSLEAPYDIYELINKYNYIVLKVADNGGIPVLKEILSLIDNDITEPITAPETQTNDNKKVIDFSSKLQEKQEQKEINEYKERFLSDILPHITKDELKLLQEIATSQNETKLYLYMNDLENIVSQRQKKSKSK